MGKLRIVAALCVAGLAFSLAPASAVPNAADDTQFVARRGGSLTTSPATYVGGQAITFAGNIGTPGQRKVTLQLHVNRPGDAWFPVRGFAGATTSADGSFNFQFQAPSMFGIRYRVVSGKRATSPVSFNAKVQDITMQVEGVNPDHDLAANTAVAGEPFTLAVNAAPGGMPVFAGRGLTLQRRIDGDTWEDVAQSSVGGDGRATFAGMTPPVGTFVYRVVAADIASGANRIGWIQTFPTYVTVLETAPTTTLTTKILPLLRADVDPVAGHRSGASTTASGKYGWYPHLWDYTWEAGQSLASPADSGSDPDGWWQDYADGAGRVGKLNGGLYLDSQRGPRGRGDFGTTRATLMNSARPYGRWEARMRLLSGESSDADFRVLVELVPDQASDYACGRRNIVLAEVSPYANSVSFGVKADTTQWARSMAIPSLLRSAPAVAVEVSPRHITWFWDGRPIGTVKSRAAVSDVPMTLRFSLVGDQVGEYDKTGLNSDWQRGFDLGRGRLVTNGPRLTESALTSCEQ